MALYSLFNYVYVQLETQDGNTVCHGVPRQAITRLRGVVAEAEHPKLQCELVG